MIQNRIKVSINGVSYALVSDEEQSQLIQAAHMVDEMLQAIHGTGIVEREKATIFVALQLAVRLLKQEASEKLHAQETQRLLTKLENDTHFL